MAVTNWLQTRRVARCAGCGHRIPRSAFVERVNGKVIILCHAPRATPRWDGSMLGAVYGVRVAG